MMKGGGKYLVVLAPLLAFSGCNSAGRPPPLQSQISKSDAQIKVDAAKYPIKPGPAIDAAKSMAYQLGGYASSAEITCVAAPDFREYDFTKHRLEPNTAAVLMSSYAQGHADTDKKLGGRAVAAKDPASCSASEDKYYDELQKMNEFMRKLRSNDY